MLRAGFTDVFVTGMLIKWISVSPSPIAIARVVDSSQVALHSARDGENPWFAIVLDRVVLVAAASGVSKHRRDIGDLVVVRNSSEIEEVRSRLSSAQRLPTILGDVRVEPSSPRLPLILGADPYPDFPPTDLAFGPTIAVALGAAYAAAGLAGRMQAMVPTNSQRGVSEAEAIWVIEAIATESAVVAERSRPRWSIGRRRDAE